MAEKAGSDKVRIVNNVAIFFIYEHLGYKSNKNRNNSYKRYVKIAHK